MNWYNEIDPFKAEWLRQLITAGHIAPGDVDERSIADVKPAELMGYAQCHFFAGIGVWSYALRNAGWDDERPVWTGSCPCPSFSAAGKGEGFADARHLWPVWFNLIRECRPASVFGEQVGSAIGHGWLDLVHSDLEGEAYAVAAAVLGACSVGAPHIRQRLYFCAHTDGGLPGNGDIQRGGQHGLFAPDRGTGECKYADAGRSQVGRAESVEGMGRRSKGRATCSPVCAEVEEPSDRSGDGSDTAQRGQPVCGSASGNAGHAPCAGEPERGHEPIGPRLEGHFGDVREWRGPGWLDPLTARSVAEAGATRGFWADCDWWYGRDGKYRPIGSGLQPLVNGATGRVGRLRGFGDAIVSSTAQAFIEASTGSEDAE